MITSDDLCHYSYSYSYSYYKEFISWEVNLSMRVKVGDEYSEIKYTSFNFKDHVRNSIAKANRTIAWVTRSIISREPSVMLGLYKSLIKPHIEYFSGMGSNG